MHKIRQRKKSPESAAQFFIVICVKYKEYTAKDNLF